MKRRSLLLGGLVAGAAAVFGVKPTVPVPSLPAVAKAYDNGDGWDGEDWDDEYADDYTDAPLAPVSMDGAYITETSAATFIPLLWSLEAIEARERGLEGAGFAIDMWGRIDRVTPGKTISIPKLSNFTVNKSDGSTVQWSTIPDDSA